MTLVEVLSTRALLVPILFLAGLVVIGVHVVRAAWHTHRHHPPAERGWLFARKEPRA